MTHSAARPVLGILGGSGVYDIEGLSHKRWQRVPSAFGEPSDELLFGELDGQAMVFLPRHGRGHRIPPSEINYRANIDALKRSGVTTQSSGCQASMTPSGRAGGRRACSYHMLATPSRVSALPSWAF